MFPGVDKLTATKQKYEKENHRTEPQVNVKSSQWRMLLLSPGTRTDEYAEMESKR